MENVCRKQNISWSLTAVDVLSFKLTFNFVIFRTLQELKNDQSAFRLRHLLQKSIRKVEVCKGFKEKSKCLYILRRKEICRKKGEQFNIQCDLGREQIKEGARIWTKQFCRTQACWCWRTSDERTSTHMKNTVTADRWRDLTEIRLVCLVFWCSSVFLLFVGDILTNKKQSGKHRSWKRRRRGQNNKMKTRCFCLLWLLTCWSVLWLIQCCMFSCRVGFVCI